MASGIQMMKEFTLGGRVVEITRQGAMINFAGNYVFAAAQKSGFKDYTLEVILNALLNRQLSAQEYIKQANTSKIGSVAIIDRKVG